MQNTHVIWESMAQNALTKADNADMVGPLIKSYFTTNAEFHH